MEYNGTSWYSSGGISLMNLDIKYFYYFTCCDTRWRGREILADLKEIGEYFNKRIASGCDCTQMNHGMNMYIQYILHITSYIYNIIYNIIRNT